MNWTSERVRSTFVDYFVNKNHKFIKSSSVIPHNDKSLLFVNAGMNQFKSIFLGKHSGAKTYPNATNYQKCIRAGGKHNDLNDVGKDTYHHTFFEMLGNWSFGDYFKGEAIDYSWDLLVNVYGLDKSKLYVTYFKGDDVVEPDLETRDLWLKYLPEDRVLPFCRENFWEMGDSGPCGPCTEIHYGDEGLSHLVNTSDKVIEIWNIVFMEYNKDVNGRLTVLPNKHIDTGMGLERIVRILQGKSSNYDTDVFEPIINMICERAKVVYGECEDVDMSVRIIADHIRTLVFSIADGLLPSSKGRGYVLRRILRRALRYGRQYLNFEGEFMSDIVDVVVEKFGNVYSELLENVDHVKEVILYEEKKFVVALKNGMGKFNMMVSKKRMLDGNDVLLLMGTYGFPFDLVKIMCDEIGVGIEDYSVRVEDVKNRRNEFDVNVDGLIVDKVFGTHDVFKYEEVNIIAKVVAVLEDKYVVLDKTSFYAESGGQESDIGCLKIFNDVVFEVEKVCKVGDYAVHFGNNCGIKVGDRVECWVNYERRRLLCKGHTCTHVLGAALENVLKCNVKQKGSLISGDKFRFDFGARNSLTVGQIGEIEKYVMDVIGEGIDVETGYRSVSYAKKIDGIKFLEDEDYDETVRFVKIGNKSIELCGGTHVNNTKDIGRFVVVGDKSVSVGVRRIVGVVGDMADKAIETGVMLQEFSSCCDVLEKLSELRCKMECMVIPLTVRIGMEEKIKDVENKLKCAGKSESKREKEGICKFIGKKIVVECMSNGLSHRLLNDAGNVLITNAEGDVAVMLLSRCGEKINVVTMVTNGLIGRGLLATDWIKQIVSVGGGKQHVAQGTMNMKDFDENVVVEKAVGYCSRF